MENVEVAVFPGSFDPVHYGHIDVLRSAARLFNTVHWVIGVNGTKKAKFTQEERLAMMRMVGESYGLVNVHIGYFYGLTANYAQNVKAGYIVRSVRMTMDFEYEMQLAMLNKKIAPDVETVYLPAHQDHLHISSTAVRELLKHGQSINDYMPLHLVLYATQAYRDYRNVDTQGREYAG